MHPQVKQATPGNCHHCGMTLVKDDDSSNSKATIQSNLPKETILPVIVIFVILLVLVGIVEYVQGHFVLLEAMRIYMAGFFIIFGGLKLLDLKGFADTYAGYDILAKRSRTYALVYPFIEVLLGLSYAFGFALLTTSIVTLVIMSVSSIGVFIAVLGKQKIRCACLGTYFKLPMTTITIMEDVSMALMALVMIIIILL